MYIVMWCLGGMSSSSIGDEADVIIQHSVHMQTPTSRLRLQVASGRVLCLRCTTRDLSCWAHFAIQTFFRVELKFHCLTDCASSSSGHSFHATTLRAVKTLIIKSVLLRGSHGISVSLPSRIMCLPRLAVGPHFAPLRSPRPFFFRSL